MRFKRILVAFVAIVVIIAGVLVIKNRAKIVQKVSPTASPSIQQQIESKFKGLVIPTDAEKIELKDVSGGSGMGITTRNEILADLPELPNGQFYQGWLGKDGKTVLLGTLELAKGGWILNYNSSMYPGYNKVVVTVGEKHIPEGSY
ncbi:MAG: anti-sigma factor [Candidatus Woesebacteria bacterium]|nr:anti-sigma factor [Candidatus Woesebacteria bacterium]